ncbi:uncharacterized protein TrAtP1_012742 [Trichoderma atroviride]|uniref:uncharacterized protein n=1 Tax=Hypocrea atroviridis TaxID=63577 RepID=UPI00332AED8B|nr:hypothetical protein TrAtP1_012742 [Trichoderma atroviride]
MPRPAGRFSGAPYGIGGVWTIGPAASPRKPPAPRRRWLSSDREQRPAPGASAPPACCDTLTLALRGIAAAHLGLQCLDPARLRDTLIPRGVGASIAARFLTAL